jgi:hypothetical protein
MSRSSNGDGCDNINSAHRTPCLSAGNHGSSPCRDTITKGENMKYIKEFVRGETSVYDWISTRRMLLNYRYSLMDIIAQALEDAHQDASHESGDYYCNEHTKRQYNPPITPTNCQYKVLYDRMYALFSTGIYGKQKLKHLEKSISYIKEFVSK